MTIISARNVNKYFYVPEELHALRDVSLDVAPGEVVVIIGPSGSGPHATIKSSHAANKDPTCCN